MSNHFDVCLHLLLHICARLNPGAPLPDLTFPPSDPSKLLDFQAEIDRLIARACKIQSNQLYRQYFCCCVVVASTTRRPNSFLESFVFSKFFAFIMQVSFTLLEFYNTYAVAKRRIAGGYFTSLPWYSALRSYHILQQSTRKSSKSYAEMFAETYSKNSSQFIGSSATSTMDPSSFCNLFEDSVQISHNDITFALNPGEVDEPQEANQGLLGKIISCQRFGKTAIQGSLKLSWNSIKGWKWKEIEDSIIQFTFASREDALNVLARRPWFVSGALIVIMPWPAWLSPTEVRFDKTPMWVRIESIPPFYWNLSNLKELASKASPVYELPLALRTQCQRLKDLWLQYRYERLPKLCFKCGVLTHDRSICFKSQTVIKDANKNFYPMFRVWLKSDAPEKSTFTAPLTKWFQDWIKVHKAIQNSEAAEMRECRRQYPGKKRIVTEEDETTGDPKSDLVITQIALVYLPGIGEIAPYGNNSKIVSIQELQEAAEKFAATKANNKACSVVSLSSKTKVRESRDPTNHYNDSLLGSQAQFINWPSKECWAQPKARELLLGALTVDKYHRVPTLFNHILDIEDFKVHEHLNGPRKRKASDGILYRPNAQPDPTQTLSTQTNYAENDVPSNRDVHDEAASQTKNIPASNTEEILNGRSFSHGSNEEPKPSSRRGKGKGTVRAAISEMGSRKRRGRPPKIQSPLAATPKSFKGGKNAKARTGGKFTTTSHWDDRTFDLQILLEYRSFCWVLMGRPTVWITSSFGKMCMVHRAGLIDLGFQGPGFTWAKGGRNSGGGRAMRRARLDRGLASANWRILFPNAVINHLVASESNYWPLLLNTMEGAKCKGRQFNLESEVTCQSHGQFPQKGESHKQKTSELEQVTIHEFISASSKSEVPTAGGYNPRGKIILGLFRLLLQKFESDNQLLKVLCFLLQGSVGWYGCQYGINSLVMATLAAEDEFSPSVKFVGSGSGLVERLGIAALK
ncbi:hypothetical protein F8388_000301 [Cannabis sativa]|uniref:DUF4283 domain-containing protein n=1 Tax=Cannabis sativa TaxID=3483 RepID=A0A7J6FN69_CANSA|nr:hypothetical protein F8388_000301 [Cannabis sativa]